MPARALSAQEYALQPSGASGSGRWSLADEATPRGWGGRTPLDDRDTSGEIKSSPALPLNHLDDKVGSDQHPHRPPPLGVAPLGELGVAGRVNPKP